MHNETKRAHEDYNKFNSFTKFWSNRTAVTDNELHLSLVSTSHTNNNLFLRQCQCKEIVYIIITSNLF